MSEDKKLSGRTARALLFYLEGRKDYEVIGVVDDGVINKYSLDPDDGVLRSHILDPIRDAVFDDDQREYGHIWIVAKNDGGIAFIRFTEVDDDLEVDIPRSELESVMIAWLAEDDRVKDQPIRGDILMIKKIAEDKAIIKHHINAFK